MRIANHGSLALLAAVACGGGGLDMPDASMGQPDAGGSADETAPAVVSTSPEDGEDDVSPTAVISIAFSEAVAEEAITETSVALAKADVERAMRSPRG